MFTSTTLFHGIRTACCGRRDAGMRQPPVMVVSVLVVIPQPSSMMYFYVSSVFETLVVVKLASSVWCEDEKYVITCNDWYVSFLRPESKTTGGYAYPLKEVQLITLRTLFPRNSIKNSVTKKHITCVVLAVAFELIAVIAGLELYGTTGRGPQADLIVVCNVKRVVVITRYR